MAQPASLAATEFGARLRAVRDEQGLSQQAVADAAGLHVAYVGQVERGQRNVSLHNILRLAAALSTTPGRLMDGLPDPDAPPPKPKKRSATKRATRR